MKTVADEWSDFRKKVIPRDASPVQLRETKRGFYAGAQAMLALLMEATDSPGADATDQDVAALDRLAKELRAFAASVGGELPG